MSNSCHKFFVLLEETFSPQKKRKWWCHCGKRTSRKQIQALGTQREEDVGGVVYNKVQHAAEAMAVERSGWSKDSTSARHTKTAKSVRKSKK